MAVSTSSFLRSAPSVSGDAGPGGYPATAASPQWAAAPTSPAWGDTGCPAPAHEDRFFRHHSLVSWDIDADEARELVEEYLAAMQPPADEEWIVTRVDERDWGWVISWVNRRAAEGSHDVRDWSAGGGPFLVDRQTGRVAQSGSAYSVEHCIELWRAGEWPDTPRPESA